jgi:predicted transcriptional regulator
VLALPEWSAEEAIFGLVHEYGTVTRRDVLRAIRRRRDVVVTVLRALVDAGRLVEHRTPRPFRYALPENSA